MRGICRRDNTCFTHDEMPLTVEEIFELSHQLFRLYQFGYCDLHRRPVRNLPARLTLIAPNRIASIESLQFDAAGAGFTL
jgi:hypothetical protein